MRKNLIVLFSLLSLVDVLCGQTPQDTARFEELMFNGTNGLTMPYRLAMPENYDPAQRYPLVLFLHGAGERGTDNAITLKHGAMYFVDKNFQSNHPCFVVVPQCPKEMRWVEVDWGLKEHTQPAVPSKALQNVTELLAEMQRTYSIDADRLYITGISMGGFGTWDMICRYPRMFAAAAPVCGGADLAKAKKIAKMPIWAFHGAKDKVVLTARSRSMIDRLKALGSKVAKYTEYADVGHNAWDFAYKTPELYEWLFSNTRKK